MLVSLDVKIGFQSVLSPRTSPGLKTDCQETNFNGRNGERGEKYNREVGPGDWALSHSV